MAFINYQFVFSRGEIRKYKHSNAESSIQRVTLFANIVTAALTRTRLERSLASEHRAIY